ncbi:U8 snoRNA-decapping enzyme-like [Chiroxiphia lanceolata]|uniref:U8 snoRNA-decapping enzyme-like n=1 Tax=Chiroxiphia lanceolata TaxID=296741 RepID=UPI0013CEEDE9|nr:U8 snoRNA-decapping enzyme-like [Chiroxiphia lanceolata]
MQLRFDGRFGFPGGLAERGESLEAAVERELREELGPGAAALRVRPGDHRGARAWPREGGVAPGEGAGLVTHLYERRLRLEELERIERGGAGAAEHGLEVQGLVRVPLGGGLGAFLRNRFAGDAREQLLRALPALGIDPPPVADPPPIEDPLEPPPGPGQPLPPAAGEEGGDPPPRVRTLQNPPPGTRRRGLELRGGAFVTPINLYYNIFLDIKRKLYKFLTQNVQKWSEKGCGDGGDFGGVQGLQTP